jgi:hypothetical protein
LSLSVVYAVGTCLAWAILLAGLPVAAHLLAGDRLRRRRREPSARPTDPRLAAACWTQTDHDDVVAGHAWVAAAHRSRRVNRPPLDLTEAALLAPAAPLRTSVCPACLTIHDAYTDSVACAQCGTATMRPARIGAADRSVAPRRRRPAAQPAQERV